MNRVKKGSGWEFLLAIREPAFTWSPASGCNNTECAVRQRGVCWAEKIVKRLGRVCPLCPSFKPHMHDGEHGTPDRLMEPFSFKKPAAITPVSTGDLFGLYPDQVDTILCRTLEASWHIFPVLTKLPQNAHTFSPFYKNIWFGVTVNKQQDTWRLDELEKIAAPVRWAIFEPLYSAIDYDLSWLDWIVIGGESRGRKFYPPPKEWIDDLLNKARDCDVPVYIKRNAGFDKVIRESPKVCMHALT